jgi:CRISPR/Cas system-associated exonuclease Cas4 (RecB family)
MVQKSVVVSASELLSWRHCRKQWELRYVRGIRSPEYAVNLAAGTATHEAIQARLEGRIDEGKQYAYAESILRRDLLERADFPEVVSKQMPRVRSALGKVPAWVYEDKQEWHVEELNETDVGEGVRLRWKPDLYLVHEDYVYVVDFKMSQTKISTYMLYNPQLSYYAVGLDKMYGKLVQYLYVTLPPRTEPVRVLPWVFDKGQIEAARAEICMDAHEVGTLPLVLKRSNACEYCEYARICTEQITGGDPEDMIAEYYVEEKKGRVRVLQRL